MKKVSNNGFLSNGDKFSSELRGQPRKSDIQRRKHAPHYGGDDNDGERHHGHRNQPSKNLIRVQLRRIQQLF